MRCRRICRELLWLARFGEFGPSSAPHLDHLARCSGCRDEVGFDRALVQQLRVALAERIEAAAPSPAAWGAILREAQRPESRGTRFRAWSATLVGRLRTATAMAGTGLALVLALNTEVVPVIVSDGGERSSGASAVAQESPRVRHRSALAEPSLPANDIVVDTGVVAVDPDPEAVLIRADARIQPRPSLDEEDGEPAGDTTTTELRLVVPGRVAPGVEAGAVSTVAPAAAHSDDRLRAAPNEPF